MGVLGLTPFLQKTCPEVIKLLPERLKGLAGRRIVIDGTLITQRLHFVALPHPYRHVLGWYRLVKELQDFDINAICVFDGKERNIAKAKETLRRQETRRLTTAREIIENDRLERLKNLGGVLHKFRSLDASGRHRVVDMMRESALKDEPPPFVLSDNLFAPSDVVLQDYPPVEHSEIDISQIQPGPIASYLSVAQFMDEDIRLPKADSYEDYSRTDIEQYVPPSPRTVTLPITPTPPQDQDIANALISLYQSFRDSIPKLISIPAAPVPSTSDDPEVRTEYMMSKGQYQLVLDENRLWDRLRDGYQTVDTVTEALQTVYDKSSCMSDSYARRTNPPTTKTYAECREIIEAMGIPCIESEGAYEAEALASSLVINGLADYVASEDTDVVVYDAPLLRNLTNRQGPLMILSGPDIREGLQLSRAGFVDFALLLGTRTIEAIVDKETKYPPRTNLDAYLEEVTVARNVFHTLPPVPQSAVEATGQRNEAKVREIMAKYNLAREVGWDHGTALLGNFFGDDPSSGAQPDISTYGLLHRRQSDIQVTSNDVAWT
ncbi:PIN domain-like protein [Hymenopellis radicata]|nr:PIN domain-like protein [Hymenopellis radicata]